LYLLGQSYEGEIAMMRARPINEAAKARMIADFTKGATEAYDRILTRYPVMDRADDAKARLLALHQPVPRATKAAIAENKAEEDSRKEPSKFSKVMGTFEKHPSVAEATKVGEPTLVDPAPMSATQVMQAATRAALGTGGASDSHSVSIETVKGAPGPDQPAPRSDTPAPAADTAAVTVTNPASTDAAPPPAAAQPDPNELKPNVGPADPNELKPNVSDDNNGQALPPPQQVNEIQSGAAAQPATGGVSPAAASGAKTADSSASSATDQSDDSDTTASSKHKKKKGIHKVVPF
jgi:outer membrane protein assembly factor BamD